MKDQYYDLTVIVSNLNKAILDNIESILHENGIYDLKPMQVLALVNIGEEKRSVGQVYKGGHYLGTNATYCLNKLEKLGYISRTGASNDQRATYIAITKKGLDVLQIYERGIMSQAQSLKAKGICDKSIQGVSDILEKIIKYTG